MFNHLMLTIEVLAVAASHATYKITTIPTGKLDVHHRIPECEVVRPPTLRIKVQRRNTRERVQLWLLESLNHAYAFDVSILVCVV